MIERILLKAIPHLYVAAGSSQVLIHRLHHLCPWRHVQLLCFLFVNPWMVVWTLLSQVIIPLDSLLSDLFNTVLIAHDNFGLSAG
jgi:hypothetical protein